MKSKKPTIRAVSLSQLHAKLKPRSLKSSKSVTSGRRISKIYCLFAAVVLFATTTFWAILGAKLQSANADQLANTYLFENWHTFRQATLPASHSFLLKWPVFLLIKFLGASDFVIMAVTVALCLLTVVCLAYLLYRIDKRPAVIGTLLLALASVLLLVPPTPYAGALLPVNMAMLATRNLEYVMYVASLIVLIRSPRIKSWGFWLALLGISILGASDKLFLTLSIGGALGAVTVYILSGRWRVARLSAKWLCLSIVAFIASVGVIGVINRSGLTHIAGDFNQGPYGFVHNIHDVGLGTVFAISGIVTNFGANPASDAVILRDFPKLLIKHLFSPAGLGYIINGAIVITAVFFAVRVFHVTIKRPKKKTKQLNTPVVLSVFLIFSSIAATAGFISTKHSYGVDARYLAIWPITLFIVAATYFRTKKIKNDKPLLIGGALTTLGICLALFSVLKTAQTDATALLEVQRRNIVISQTVNAHPVDVLVGDYWRVLPIKSVSGGSLRVNPLENCTKSRQVLSSKDWQPDLKKHSFAYLISLDKNLTDYPNCTIDQVLKFYGRPNQSSLIAGTFSQPKELLLFYDYGISIKNAQARPLGYNNGSVLPVLLDQLTDTMCPDNQTGVMNIVAHQDDDLLFLSPDLLHDIDAGRCVTTIYLTAGDAGLNKQYWQEREKGSEAAYSRMLGTGTEWEHRIVKLSDKQFITVSNPRGNPKISLIFMRLADGNLQGQGFGASRHESLERLDDGRAKDIHSVDGQSIYTSDLLTKSISRLLTSFQPAEVRTTVPHKEGHIFPDHSDHTAAGRYAERALGVNPASQPVLIKFYVGYPVHEKSVNVTEGDLTQKQAAFMAYAQHDGGVCTTLGLCQLAPVYQTYLQRQYTLP